MQFTQHGMELIIKAVRSSPLGPLEIRRVVGLGSLYIARDDTRHHKHFPTLMKLLIDGMRYRLCWKKPNTGPDPSDRPEEFDPDSCKPERRVPLRLVD